MNNLFDEDQIYRVTFGMKYESSNRQLFLNKLKVNLVGCDCSIKLPMYALMKEGKLVEIFTGIEIPVVMDRMQPGFGAYFISPLYTFDDFHKLRENIMWIKICYDDYKKTLNMIIDDLNSLKSVYQHSHFDDYGRLSIPSEERERKKMCLHEDNIVNCYKMIKKLNIK